MRNERGFNMVGVIIAAGLFAFLALAASEFLSNMFKGIRAVDVKMQSQDFASTLRLALSKQDQCILLLGLDKTPLEIPIEEYEKAVKGAEISIPVPQIVLGKKIYKKDTEVQDLKLLEMAIRISAPDAKDGNEHTGSLVAPLELLRGKKMYTIPQYLAKIPLKVKVERDGVKAKVVACNSETPAIDPQVVCTDLGGRWLTGDYMPKDRCSVGADITLAANELPEGIPGQGGINDEGERVEVCYYQKAGNTRVLEYACPNTWGTRKGPRCAFDVKTGLWGVWDFNSSGVAKKLRFNCVKGVKISVKTPDNAYLELDEPVYKGWEETPPSDTDPASGFSATDQDRLTAAGRCQYLPDSELYYDCNNATATNALQAKAGSCVFVKGIRFGAGSAAASRIAAYNNLNGTAVNPAAYTGWVRVSSARAFIPKGGSPAQSLIREASGTPCFRVEMRLANAGDTGLGQPSIAAPADLLADPTQARQCVHEATALESLGASAVPGAPPKRKSIFSCDNSALSPDELVDLAVGQCWYVHDTRIIGYHEGGAGGNVEAPATGGDLGTRYTGWVYLKAQLPDGRFTLSPSGELVPTTPNANNSRANAIPCNAGIRAPVPAESP